MVHGPVEILYMLQFMADKGDKGLINLLISKGKYVGHSTAANNTCAVETFDNLSYSVHSVDKLYWNMWVLMQFLILFVFDRSW